MTRVIACSLIAAMLMTAVPLQAQERATELEKIVVTGTKTETPVEQTGASVSIITRDEIKLRNAADVIQVLREQPGVSLIQTGSRGALNGDLFVRGGNSDMNLVLIDGMKVNQGGGAFNFRDFSTAGIGRIEFVRGPQSAIHGADALTSVIQFFTPRGEGPLSAWAQGLAGNFDTTEERVGVSWGTKRAGVFFEFERVDTTGILDKNNEFRNHVGALRLDVSPVPDLELTLTGRFNQSRIEFPTENEGDRLQVFLDPRMFFETERFLSTFGVKWRQAKWLEHRAKVGINLEDRINVDPRDLPPDPATRPPEGVRTTSTEERFLADYSAALDLPVWAGITPRLVLGASYDKQEFMQRTRPVTRPGRINNEREGHAGYGQVQVGWRDTVFLTGGARYDHSTAYGHEVSPRVSLAVIAPPASTRLRGAWGTGIKEPSFSAEFGIPALGTPGNADIKPEHSESWELGVDQPLLDKKVELGVTYFQNRFEDLIAFVSTAVGFQNIQAAKTQGVELVARVKPWQGWSATGNYTFLDTEVIADAGIGGTALPHGQPFLRRPKHSGSVSVGYADDRFSAVAALFVKGDSIDRDFRPGAGSARITLDGYEKLDLSAAYIVAKNVLGLSEITWKLRVQNLLNEKYEEVFGFSSPRLAFVTGFEVRY